MPEETPVTAVTDTKPTKSAAERIADSIQSMDDNVKAANERMDGLQDNLEKLQKAQRPDFPAPAGIVGESPNASRSMSFARAIRAVRTDNWEAAKLEAEISEGIYNALGGDLPHGKCVYLPYDSKKLPTEENVAYFGDKQKQQLIPDKLANLCRAVSGMELKGVDWGHMPGLSRNVGRSGALQGQMHTKDLTVGGAATGAELREAAGLGELIDFLRPMSIMSQAGVPEVPLPRSGRINFPKFTSDPTVNAFAENGTITESTPGTATVSLDANKYAAIVDYTSEILRFASIDLEAWLRMAMAEQLALDFDSDMFVGASGGDNTAGWITLSGVNTNTASTVGANGDTLSPTDIVDAIGLVAGDSVNLDSMHVALRPELWFGILTRRADAVSAADGAGEYLLQPHLNYFGGVPMSIHGYPVIASTNVSNTRTKASGTDLTYAVAFAAREWMIGRHGVVEITNTDSHASNFVSDILSIKATVFQDAVARHAEGACFIDDLING